MNVTNIPKLNYNYNEEGMGLFPYIIVGEHL